MYFQGFTMVNQKISLETTLRSWVHINRSPAWWGVASGTSPSRKPWSSPVQRLEPWFHQGWTRTCSQDPAVLSPSGRPRVSWQPRKVSFNCERKAEISFLPEAERSSLLFWSRWSWPALGTHQAQSTELLRDQLRLGWRSIKRTRHTWRPFFLGADILTSDILTWWLV